MSAYRGHGRSAALNGYHLTNNAQAAQLKRSMMLFFHWALSNSSFQGAAYCQHRVVSPQHKWRIHSVFYDCFVRGPWFCPCALKTSMFSINNFHFSSANVNVARDKVHRSPNNAKGRNGRRAVQICWIASLASFRRWLRVWHWRDVDVWQFGLLSDHAWFQRLWGL